VQGELKTFLPEKGYGFIKGDDNKDYFLHVKDLTDPGDKDRLAEGVILEFDQKATPKGYQATQCQLLNSEDIDTYVEPDRTLAIKDDEVKGWEIIELSHWLVIGSSDDSPDAAWTLAKRYAREIGGNAIINAQYYKTTGSKATSHSAFKSHYGGGTHNFTIHNVSGTVVSLGKKHAKGNLKIDQLTGINEKAERIRNELDKKAKRSTRKNQLLLFASLLILFGGLMIGLGPAPGIVSLAAWFLIAIFTRSSDNQEWLHNRFDLINNGSK
jgi:cold shock CspA family protein